LYFGGMNNNLIAYIAIGCAILLGLIWITREIFSIPALLRNLKAIVKLLALNAEKSGYPKEQIDAIVKEAEKQEAK
jgi:hypothetical protein